MTPRSLALAISLVLSLPAGTAAQGTSEEQAGSDRGATYLKIGLAHWQGDVFSPGSFTQWNGDPFGADYTLTSVRVGIETYFDQPRLLLSGWAIGYRKDALGQMTSGHMLHGGVFRSINLGVFSLRAAGGVEGGVPSLNFDTTTFDYRADGALRYNHTYPVKNADVPGVGTTHDGVLYPFLEASIVERFGPLLLEGGMRINLVRFQFDTYQVDPTDRVTHTFHTDRVPMPMLFVDIGLRVF